jgi:hypothetical protein
MSQLSQSEIAKVRKAALHSVTLNSEMKTSVVDAKLRELSAEIKKVLAKNNESINMIIIKYK